MYGHVSSPFDHFSTDRYSMDAIPSNYFTFAEQGIAVALRPGDVLLFNPQYQHCISSRTSSYESKDVFCLSLYLKSAIVENNDNTLPLMETDIYSLQGK
jgi:ectoine hydroxylase-related dioxygenase (phytanoyl-CoA dioxygenase family)